MQLDAGLIGILPLLLAVVAFIAYRLFSKWRRKRIVSRQFPGEWQQLVAANIPLYRDLNTEQQAKLHSKMQLFLAQKDFYGCAGLQVTDTMRVLIAAEACLLILHHDGEVYPDLASVLIYPSAFIARREELLEDGTVAHAATGMLGESWDAGKVILAWDAVQQGVANFTDGSNVVLHEFAHQLDSHAGGANGAPALSHNSYRTWARVLSENYDDLRARVSKGQDTVIDGYGATNPAEFFAVATETYFERPDALREHRPELYEELRRYYGFDLAGRHN